MNLGDAAEELGGDEEIVEEELDTDVEEEGEGEGEAVNLPDGEPANDNGDEEDSDEEEEPEPLDFEAIQSQKVTVKVNGEESEVTLKEAVENYQLKRASNKALEEVAEERKEWETERAELRSQIDTVEGWAKELQQPSRILPALARAGFPIKEAIEDQLKRHSRREQMTAEQRELEDAKAESARASAETERLREEQREAEVRSKQAENRRRLRGWMDTGLEAAKIPEARLNAAERLLRTDLLDYLDGEGIELTEEYVREAALRVREELGIKDDPPKTNGKAKAKPPSQVKDGSAPRTKRPKRVEKPKDDMTGFFSRLKDDADNYELPDEY